MTGVRPPEFTCKPSSALISSVVFSCIFLALNLYIYNHKNSYWLKQKALKNNSSKIDCLILGMSHAYYGISPEILGPNAISLANVGQSLAIDCALLNKCLDQCPKLKLVVLDFSYHSLRFSLFSTPGEPLRDCYYSLYHGVSEAPLWSKLVEPRYFVPSFLFGTNKTQKVLRHRLFKDPAASDVDASGWCTSKGWAKFWADNSSISEEEGRSKVQVHDKQSKEEFLKQNLAALKRVLERCREKNVKVLFVTLPVWKTYYENIDPIRWDESQKIIQSLCTTYGCTYANYLKDKRFEKSDFVDSDHLILGGGLKFSKLLYQEQIRTYLPFR